jgi:putative FmdB family regulatory protein
MPIYEFVCRKCNNDFEELVFKQDEKVPCPSCGSEKVERRMSVCAFSGGGRFRSTASSDGCGSCSKASCSGCGGH